LLIQIIDRNECTGCYACYNACKKNSINMVTDFEGFWYPIVDYNNCTRCGSCLSACPVNCQIVTDRKPIAYACYNIDEKVRMGSSSGGLFSLIAEQVINSGGIVFGAGFDKYFTVIHSWVDLKEELGKFRGSKYVQSKIGETYKQVEEFLKQERQVLFSGTPCQISGLKSYLKRDYNNLICIDIICHGVPSPKVWQKYISYQEKRAGSPIRKIIFRLKKEGWKRYSVSFLFNNDMVFVQTFDKNLYMKAFLTDICLRPSCYKCKYKNLNRDSDITLADFWGIQNLLPEMDDDKGTSLVIVNSIGGKLMFEGIKDRIQYKEANINEAICYNKSAINSAIENSKRKKFFANIDRLQFDNLVNKYCSGSIIIKIQGKAKSMARKVLKKTGLLK